MGKNSLFKFKTNKKNKKVDKPLKTNLEFKNDKQIEDLSFLNEQKELEKERLAQIEAEKQKQIQEQKNEELDLFKILKELKDYLGKDYTDEELKDLSFIEKRKLIIQAKKNKEKQDFEEEGANDFLDNIKKVVEEYPSRISASKNEKKAGLLIKKLSQEKLNNKASMEPFFVKQFANSYSTIVIAILLLLSFCFIFNLPVISLIIYLFAIGFFITQIALKTNIMSFMFSKKPSYNIVNQVKSKKATEKTLILASHYDCPYNWNYTKNGSAIFKTLLISDFILNILNLLLLIIEVAGIKNVAVLVITSIIMLVNIAFFVGFYKFKTKKATNNLNYGLNGVAMALSMSKYIKDNNLLDDSTQLVFASFASECNGAKGSEAFINQHLAKDGLLVNPTVIDFESCNLDKMTIVKKALFSKKENDNTLRDIAYEIYDKNGIKVTKEEAIFNGKTSINFEKNNIKSLGLTYSTKNLPKDLYNENDNEIITQEDAKKLFIINKQLIDKIIENL